MADQLYLSLWFPNFRVEALPQALVCVLRQFATISGDKRVTAASAYPIDFTETPTYQRIYVNDERAADTPDTAASAIESAVAEATEQLHDDTAYEFEMTWNLWHPADPAQPTPDTATSAASSGGTPPSGQASAIPQDSFDDITPRPASPSEEACDVPEDSFDDIAPRSAKKPIPFPSKTTAPTEEPTWIRRPTTVRILGFGPDFDQSGYAQNGHIRVDFGLDTPWTLEELPPAASTPNAHTTPSPSHPTSTTHAEATKHTQQNIEMLLAFTLLVEKHCTLSSRLLWTESGEPLAEKLIARLQKLH